MRKLKVNLVELEAALDFASWEASYYLDLDTGRVLMITAEQGLIVPLKENTDAPG